MSVRELKDDRWLCWDEDIIASKSNVTVKMQKPVPKNLAVVCDGEWDGVHNGYASVINVDGKYKFYYRASSQYFAADGTLPERGPNCFAMYESLDGINFKRPIIGKHEFNGKKFNNIFHIEYDKFGSCGMDNFSVYYDENPDCDPKEKYKGLALGPVEKWVDGVPAGGSALLLYTSENGVDFVNNRPLDIPGTFDSFNIMFWDKDREEYWVFYRDFHVKGDLTTSEGAGIGTGWNARDIRLATSKDLIHFELHGPILFNEGKSIDDLQFYTNQIMKYPRAKDMYIGLPARYVDRSDDAENFEEMPMYDMRQFVTKHYGRGGTALTDCAILTSRDGLHFNRWDEAFLTPGPEAMTTWWYGDCYTCYGLAETPSEIEGAANEISFYMGENYRISNVHFRRYTVRLDGFFSWYAGYTGGEVLTKPLTFDGKEMEINFETSALGNLQIIICDENGTPLEGYTSGNMFGNSVDRKVRFKAPLDALAGKTVRIKFALRDCELYAFKFNK